MKCECIVPSPATAASSASAESCIPQEFCCRLICFIDCCKDLQCKHTSFLHSGLSKAEVCQSQIVNVGCYKYSSWPPEKRPTEIRQYNHPHYIIHDYISELLISMSDWFNPASQALTYFNCLVDPTRWFIIEGGRRPAINDLTSDSTHYHRPCLYFCK